MASRTVGRARVGWLLAAAVGACAAPPSVAPSEPALAAAESSYAVLRDLRDRIDVGTEARTPVSPLIVRYDSLRPQLSLRLAAVDSSRLHGDDARALGIMRRALARDLGPLPDTVGSTAGTPGSPPECTYDARTVAATPSGLDALRARIYACYGWTQTHVAAGADTLDRLSILGALGSTADSTRRRELFLALAPVWRSVNGDGTPASPYRQLIALEARSHAGTESPVAAQVRATGLPPDSLERWLLAILETWRNVTPDSLVEPWDWYYETGSADRTLSPRISRERLISLNAEVWRSLGADVGALRVHYDLEPRDGKDPVASTTFGGRWPTIEPWVSATYGTGGLGNLNELLHETGHAVHLAAIRTRPAFLDWPDSDPFTEAIADVVALDVYDPVWEQHWLGDSVPLREGLRGRYGALVLDVAWALLEARMLRDPAADPNEVWTGLTRDYLRIRPHPELSWWAMRGQLIDAPGYMMNYAAGGILIAAIRARIVALHGPFVTGDSTWYRWTAARLYRFGLERPTREVVKAFLGGPVSPSALLADMRRMR